MEGAVFTVSSDTKEITIAEAMTKRSFGTRLSRDRTEAGREDEERRSARDSDDLRALPGTGADERGELASLAWCLAPKTIP